MQGLMQDWPLTVDKILDHAKAWHGESEIVSRSVEGPIVRTTYAQIHERSKRVSNALLTLGVKPGDRVATLAWNTARHIEAWYGIMGVGAVCHTLNPRLFADQLCYIINHAEDRVIFTDLTFLPTLFEYRARMPMVEHVIVLSDAAHMPSDFPGALCFETLVENASPDVAWGGFDENTAAGLCYTSGTTGNPKGVLYSHRSNFLHTLVTMGSDVLGIKATDTVLPVVPMFHANAWGLAFSAPAVGAKLVMPGAKLDGASVHELLETEGVTFSAAVPTVWQMLLTHLRATNGKLTTLKRVVIGGSAVPEAIVRGFRDEYGVDVTHAWGMTETSPLGTLATPNQRIEAMDAERQLQFKLKQGRAPLGIQLKLVNDAEEPLPHDGSTFGRLKVAGPFVVREYFKGEGGALLDPKGFFDTGDVATLDEHGFMQITDRAKDVIKSGGEWISSIEIENIAAGHPKAEMAAVIGVAHPKWDERPLLLVKLRDGVTATKEEFLQFLEGKIAKWWMPDDVAFVDEIPLGATGKIDKKLIRERMKDYVLPAAPAGAVALAAPPEPKIYAPETETETDGEPEEDAWLNWTPGAAQAIEREAPAQDGDEAAIEDIEAVEAPADANVPFAAERAEAPAEAEPEPLPREPAARSEPLRLAATGAPTKVVRGGFADAYLTFATLVALAPAAMFATGVIGSQLGLANAQNGLDVMALEWAPRIALTSVAAGLLGVVVALFAGFRRFWLRVLVVLAISAATLLAYVWERQAEIGAQPIPAIGTDALSG
jgi:fatty-acyl-CoA synthase